VFKATQPYRYVVWLGRNGGNPDEADQVLTALSRSPDRREQLWALHGLALIAKTNAETKAIYQRALRLKPDFLPAIGNMPNFATAAGQEEEAYHLHQQSAVAYRAGQADYNPVHAASYALKSEADVANMKGDLLGEARMRAEAVHQVAAANIVATRPFDAAFAHAAVHDFGAARSTLAAAGYLDPVRLADVEAKYGKQGSLELLRAIATDDFGARADELQTVIASLQQDAQGAATFASPQSVDESINSLRPRFAASLARSGRWRDAEAVIAPMPDDHDAAIRARGLIAAYAGRGAASDALFARAVARTPSLPAGHYAWAEALMLRGDTARAIEQSKLASQKGPRWAEPFKLWGDALLKQRNPKVAATKYAAAAERAPRWGQLHMYWASALWRLGKRDEARAKLRAAAAMDLNDADRRQLGRMWAKANAT
jgi:Tfp pilus assembly protein PilF